MIKIEKNEQSGRSMVEMLGVLAIIGVLSVGGIAGYSKAMAKFKLTKAQDQLAMMVMNTRTAFATSAGYINLTTSMAISYKLVSTEMKAAADSLMNAFGGSTLIQAIKSGSGTDNGAFKIVFNGLGKDACTSLASSDWGTDGLLGITVSGASQVIADLPSAGATGFYLPANLPIDLATAAGKCSSDNNNSISWYYN